nr:hypothetical protein Iba_chr04aCG12220 [Ipomoea batatas]
MDLPSCAGSRFLLSSDRASSLAAHYCISIQVGCLPCRKKVEDSTYCYLKGGPVNVLFLKALSFDSGRHITGYAYSITWAVRVDCKKVEADYQDKKESISSSEETISSSLLSSSSAFTSLCGSVIFTFLSDTELFATSDFSGPACFSGLTSVSGSAEK